ncbi:unnamed protein product [Rotaria sp. Silwood1]|nr:unnamed protein product [Rotaria sp. Silwood1]CAF4969412.1 unnamed protein product [Rotaria sp. Silwood1]
MPRTIEQAQQMESVVEDMTYNESLGEQLVEYNESNNELNQVSTNELIGKYVGLYFAANSSSICRNFTPKLAAYYKGYNNRDRAKTLRQKLYVEDLPILLMADPGRRLYKDTGVEYVRDVYNGGAIRTWSKGKRLFRSREPHEGEYVWNGIICHQCYMSPIIGSRYGCLDEKCYVDLLPKQQYSFEQIFKSVPYLLNPNSEEKIETKTIWENGIKCIGFYFSAHWCGPCQIFTPKLAEVYKEAQKMFLSFRIVFVSSDNDEESFNEYHSKMPWPAVPLDSICLIKAYFQSSYIPRLFIVSSDGKILSRQGVDDVKPKGIEALKTWIQGETVAPPTADEFDWEDIYCNGCNTNPIIGQRYHCSTCDNYDLCSTCAKKGHEHPLELVPQQTEDEDD